MGPGTRVASGAADARRAGRAEWTDIAADLTQVCLDIAGFVDPTPVSDGANALISLARGNWFDAVLSGVSMVPYIGDLAKAGKFPRYLRTLENAVLLAERYADFDRLLRPIMARLGRLLELMPDVGISELRRMREVVDRYLQRGAVARIVSQALPDISRRFVFRTVEEGDFVYKMGSGRLGVPGQVMTHRSRSAQRSVSGGTGDDAGHLIGDRFGPPGGRENLSPQNWRQNQGGGTFHDLENRWARQLQEGTGIDVTVTDVFRKGEDRPVYRVARWTETSTTGARTNRELIFANPHTARSRDRQGIAPTVPPGNVGQVIDMFTREVRR